MALDTATNLKTALALHLGRAGDTKVTAVLDDVIALCEGRIAYGASPRSPFPSSALRCRLMEAQRTLVIKTPITPTSVGGTANAVTLTLAAVPASDALGDTYTWTATNTNTGAATLNSGAGVVTIKKGASLVDLEGGDIIKGGAFTTYFDGTYHVLLPNDGACPLPPGYLAMRKLRRDGNDQGGLEYITPQALDQAITSRQTSEPDVYTIEGDAIRVGPLSDTTYYLPALYYKKPTALALATTNALLTQAPQVYLYGCLLELAPFLKNDDRLPLWHGFYLGALDGLQEQDERDRHPGALRMRGDTGNP